MIAEIRIPPSDWKILFHGDHYVPLTVRTYDGTIGAKYLRFGNQRTSLLEVICDPWSGFVRGLTLLSFDQMCDRPNLEQLPIETGLPVLHNADELVNPVDSHCDIRVSVEKDIMIWWGDIEVAEMMSEWNGLYFYLEGKKLIGCRVAGLSSAQLRTIMNFATGQ